ncbi:MAG: response regulator transcription factor [Proteobacteria bacterium]|nr:response regulator transcription factor [Pseudomonadota bacterium]MBU1715382.1 response regulator transcription factor [Pseudomonadota bacterium]
MTQQKNILLVDDHPLFREGLKSVIKRDDRFQVVGEAGDGEAGLELARKMRPDLVILDISMPGKDGIQLTRKLRSVLPETKIIVVTMHSEISYITMAFQAGANGYLAKESAAEKLLKAMEAVLEHDYYLDSSLSPSVVGGLVGPSKKQSAGSAGAYGGLTPREQQVMRLLAEGFSCRDISESFFISHKTVENHRGRIMKKLGLRGDIDLIRYAARIGLIEMDSWKD